MLLLCLVSCKQHTHTKHEIVAPLLDFHRSANGGVADFKMILLFSIYFQSNSSVLQEIFWNLNTIEHKEIIILL